MKNSDDNRLIVTYVGDMTRLEVKKGDIFVVSSTEDMTMEEMQRLKALLQEELGAPVIVLCKELKLGVISKEDQRT